MSKAIVLPSRWSNQRVEFRDWEGSGFGVTVYGADGETLSDIVISGNSAKVLQDFINASYPDALDNIRTEMYRDGYSAGQDDAYDENGF